MVIFPSSFYTANHPEFRLFWFTLGIANFAFCFRFNCSQRTFRIDGRWSNVLAFLRSKSCTENRNWNLNVFATLWKR